MRTAGEWRGQAEGGLGLYDLDLASALGGGWGFFGALVHVLTLHTHLTGLEI